ncbi:S-layer homology domain-containing protein [Alteribacillus sp. HJP-4]|uniref:S-layer homology domain-containing protein n=1 Tax=Alteribacillus sp. HJP-4 TaxID=2775394 RepID=UPI0035CD3091
MKKFAGIALSASLVASLGFPAAAGAQAFPDVGEDQWAKDSIERLYEKGIVTGKQNGTFAPRDTVTRGHAAIMITNALGLDTENAPDPGFNDLDESDTYYKYAAAVAEAGIMEGRDGSFMANQPLKRDQTAKVLVEAYDIPDAESGSDFDDVDSGHWAYDYVSSILEADITTGYKDENLFGPRDTTKRDQFATFLTKTMDYSKDDSDDSDEDVERDEEIVQLLDDVFETQLGLESYTFDGNIGVSMDMPVPEDEELSEEDQAALEEMSNMDMAVRGAYESDPFVMETIVEQEMPTFDETMVMPTIVTEDASYEYIADAALSGYPEEWQDKYIEYNFANGGSGGFTDVEQQQELSREIFTLFIDEFGTEQFELVENDGTVPEDIEYEHLLTFELTNEDLEAYSDTFEEKIWPELEEMLENPETMGVSASQAEALNEEADEDFDSFLESLNLETFEMTQAIDENNHVVYDTGVIDVSFEDEEAGTMSFGVDYDMAMDNFNEDVTFEYGLPESDDDIITEEEMMEWQEEQMEETEDEFGDVEEMDPEEKENVEEEE